MFAIFEMLGIGSNFVGVEGRRNPPVTFDDLFVIIIRKLFLETDEFN